MPTATATPTNMSTMHIFAIIACLPSYRAPQAFFALAEAVVRPKPSAQPADLPCILCGNTASASLSFLVKYVKRRAPSHETRCMVKGAHDHLSLAQKNSTRQKPVC